MSEELLLTLVDEEVGELPLTLLEGDVEAEGQA